MTYVPDPIERLKKLKSILTNRNYTATEKNVAAYLLACQNSKDGRCNPSYETIADALGIERRSAIRACKALEAACEVEICHIPRNGGDGLSSNQFNFNFVETERRPHDPSQAQKSGGHGDPGVTIPPSYGDPAVTTLVTPESPPMVTLGSLKQRKKNKEREQQDSAGLFGEDELPEAPPFDFETWFEGQWWPQYPRREEKPAAKKLAKAIIEGRRRDGLKATPNELLAGVMRYAAAMADTAGTDAERYIKKPTTWLDKGCWEDERTGRPGGPRSTSTDAAVWAAIDEMAARNKRAFG